MARTNFYVGSNVVFGGTEPQAINNNIPQRLGIPVLSPLDLRGEPIVGVETDNDYKTSAVNVGFLEEQLVNQTIAFRPDFLYDGAAGNMVSFAVPNNANSFDFYIIINNRRFRSGSTPVGDDTNFLRLPLDNFYVDHYTWTDNQAYRAGDLVSADGRVYLVNIQHTVPTGATFANYYGFPLYTYSFALATPITADTTITVDGFTFDIIVDPAIHPSGVDAEYVARSFAAAYDTAKDAANPPAAIGGNDPNDGLGNNQVSISNIDTNLLDGIVIGTATSNGVTWGITQFIDPKLQLLTGPAEWQPNVRYYAGDIVIFQGKLYVAKASPAFFDSGATFDILNWIQSSADKIYEAEELDSTFIYVDGLVTQIFYGTLNNATKINEFIKFNKTFTYADGLVTDIDWFEGTDSKTPALTAPIVFPIAVGVSSRRLSENIHGVIPNQDANDVYVVDVQINGVNDSSVPFTPVLDYDSSVAVTFSSVNALNISRDNTNQIINTNDIIQIYKVNTPFREIDFEYADGLVSSKDQTDNIT